MATKRSRSFYFILKGQGTTEGAGSPLGLWDRLLRWNAGNSTAIHLFIHSIIQQRFPMDGALVGAG
jgi:hypothetical protein